MIKKALMPKPHTPTNWWWWQCSHTLRISKISKTWKYLYSANPHKLTYCTPQALNTTGHYEPARKSAYTPWLEIIASLSKKHTCSLFENGAVTPILISVKVIFCLSRCFPAPSLSHFNHSWVFTCNDWFLFLVLHYKGFWGLCQLHYPDWEIILSWLKPYSPIGGTLGDNNTFLPYECWWGGQCHTILSQLGDIIILIETLFSQCGYQKPPPPPIGKPFLDNNTFCHTCTIPLWRYSFPDWNPILPMRIPKASHRGNLLLTITPSVILSHCGDILFLIETLFSQCGYNIPQSGNPCVTTTPSAVLNLTL